MVQFIFSALYNEPADYLPLLVDNFLNFTSDECALVINVGSSITLPPSFSTPSRVQIIRAETPRSVWGATLLSGHVESFRYAERVFAGFGWFVPIASNSLFLRHFNPDLAIAAARKRERPKLPEGFDARWDALPEKWHWPKLHGFDAAAERLRSHWNIDGLFMNQIEGQLASREDWGRVATIHCDLSGLWEGLTAPLEEILPATVIDILGSGQRTEVCLVHWTPRPEGRYATLVDLTDVGTLPPHVCLIKWFRRDGFVAETISVATNFGRIVVNELQEAKGLVARTRMRVLLQSALKALEREEQLIPIKMSFQNQVDLEVTTQRQILLLKNGGATEDTDAAYLYLENTNEKLRLALRTGRSGHLQVSCKAVDEDQATTFAEPVLEGYLYISLPAFPRSEAWEGNCDILRLSGQVKGIAPQSIIRRCILHDVNYSATQPIFIDNEHGSDDRDELSPAYFNIPRPLSRMHFGVPIYKGADMEIRLDIVSH
jgi:hypothetical protein